MNDVRAFIPALPGWVCRFPPRSDIIANPGPWQTVHAWLADSANNRLRPVVHGLHQMYVVENGFELKCRSLIPIDEGVDTPVLPLITKQGAA